MLIRREVADSVGYLDTDFFVYSEEVDFQKRMHDAGWRILHVPRARAIHHEQLATDRSPGGRRRIVQFHRGRDLYMQKHHSKPVVVLSRLLWSASYVPRALAANFMRGRDPGTVLAPRPPGAATRQRRGHARGGRRVQRRPCPGRSGPRAVLVARRDLVDLGPEVGMLVLVGPGVSRRRAKALGARGDRGRA